MSTQGLLRLVTVLVWTDMETNLLIIIAICMWTALFHIDTVQSLRCWQCIADNCDKDPSYNYKAREMECLPGAFCQKVMYTDRYNNTTNPMSIVKSCSTRCEPKDNFDNCTWSKRGCVKRLCCNNTDFCNGGDRIVDSAHFPCFSVIFFLIISAVYCGS